MGQETFNLQLLIMLIILLKNLYYWKNIMLLKNFLQNENVNFVHLKLKANLSPLMSMKLFLIF